MKKFLPFVLTLSLLTLGFTMVYYRYGLDPPLDGEVVITLTDRQYGHYGVVVRKSDGSRWTVIGSRVYLPLDYRIIFVHATDRYYADQARSLTGLERFPVLFAYDANGLYGIYDLDGSTLWSMEMSPSL